MWTYFPSSIVKGLIIVLCLVVAAIYAQLYILTIPAAERIAANDVRADIADLRRVYESEGLGALRDHLAARIGVAEETGALYALADLSEQVVAGNLRAWPWSVDLKGEWSAVENVALIDGSKTSAGYAAIALEEGYLLFVGRDMSARTQLAGLLKRALLFSLVTVVVSAVVAGFALARVFNRRMQAIADAAEDIMRGDLSRRVIVGPAADEFTALAQSINMMLERIEHLMGSTRMLTDSIAHHVRGAVTRLATQLRTIEEVSSDARVKEITRRPLEETGELLRVLDGIIEIARADAGLSRAQMKPVVLDALVRDLAEIYEPLAADRGIAIETQIASGGVSVVAHQALVAQALCNLIENSIKYAAAGQKIELRAGQGPAGPFVSVSDSGPGITPEQRARAIARFSRLEMKSGSEGVGLGLSIVAAIARLHGAALSLEDNAPGLRAVLLFPTWPKRRPSWAVRSLRF